MGSRRILAPAGLLLSALLALHCCLLAPLPASASTMSTAAAAATGLTSAGARRGVRWRLQRRRPAEQIVLRPAAAATAAAGKIVAGVAGTRDGGSGDGAASQPGPGGSCWCARAEQEEAVLTDKGSASRIAIVNSQFFHLEVVAGLVHVLAPVVQQRRTAAGGSDAVLHVYLHPDNMPGGRWAHGFVDWMQSDGGYGPAVTFKPIPSRPRSMGRYDSVLFVSPEYDVATVRQLVAASQPSSVALVVHNADAGTLPQLTSALTGCSVGEAGARDRDRRRRRRALLPPCPAQLHILALAPHVARHVAGRDLPGVRREHVTWVLPVKPLNTTSAVTTDLAATGEDSLDRRAGDRGNTGNGSSSSQGRRGRISKRSTRRRSVVAVSAVTGTGVATVGEAAGRQGSGREGKRNGREAAGQVLHGNADAGQERFRRRARTAAVGSGSGPGFALLQTLRALQSVDSDSDHRVGVGLGASTEAGSNSDPGGKELGVGVSGGESPAGSGTDIHPGAARTAAGNVGGGSGGGGSGGGGSGSSSAAGGAAARAVASAGTGDSVAADDADGTSHPLLPEELEACPIKGNMASRRRKYSTLWAQLNESNELMSLPGFGVVMVGSGKPERAQLPPSLSSRVSLHVNLPYPDYYGAVAGGLGLLPLLGSPDYLATKISSSVITSLVTGLPLMLDQATLDVYGPLLHAAAAAAGELQEAEIAHTHEATRSGHQQQHQDTGFGVDSSGSTDRLVSVANHVSYGGGGQAVLPYYLQGAGETLAQAMLRVAQGPCREVAEAKGAVARLGEALNKRSRNVLCRALDLEASNA